MGLPTAVPPGDAASACASPQGTRFTQTYSDLLPEVRTLGDYADTAACFIAAISSRSAFSTGPLCSDFNTVSELHHSRILRLSSLVHPDIPLDELSPPVTSLLLLLH